MADGGWGSLIATIQTNAQEQNALANQPPLACPNDGEPLRQGPAAEMGILYCPFDGWQYPRDWDPETMSGL